MCVCAYVCMYVLVAVLEWSGTGMYVCMYVCFGRGVWGVELDRYVCMCIVRVYM